MYIPTSFHYENFNYYISPNTYYPEDLFIHFKEFIHQNAHMGNALLTLILNFPGMIRLIITYISYLGI